MKICNFAFFINNGKTKIFGSTPSNGQVEFSKQNNIIFESFTLKWSFFINFHMHAKMYGFRFNYLEVTRINSDIPNGWPWIIKVNNIYDWLKFDSLMSVIGLQTFLWFINLKKWYTVEFWQFFLEIKKYWWFCWILVTVFVCQHFISLPKMLLLCPVVCSGFI